MYPGQFYTRQFIDKWYKGRSNITSSNYKFYDSEVNSMGFINSLKAPSEETIKRIQLEEIRKNFPITDQKFATELNQFNEDFGNQNISDNFTLEDAMQIVESTLSATIGEGHVDNTNFLKLLSTHISTKEFSLDSYENALEKLKDLKNFLAERNIYNREDINKYLAAIDRSVARLEEDVRNAQQGIYGSSNYGYWFSSSGIVKNGKYGAIIGSGRRLKGFYFESETFKIMQEKLIAPLGDDYILVDTSTIMGPTFNILGLEKGSGQLRTDSMVFNKKLIDNNIKIKYIYKGAPKTASLLEFIEDCNNNAGQVVISLENDQLEKILYSDGFVAGGQTKSGWHQHPFNNFPVPASQGFALAAGQWYSFFLVMKKWYTYNHIYANAPEFDAIFNLGVSKQVGYIIGRGNSFLVLRNKIVPTITYFENMFRENYFIKGLTQVSVGQEKQIIPVNLSNKAFNYKQFSYTRFVS